MPTFAVSPTPGTPDHEIGCPEQCSDRQAILNRNFNKYFRTSEYRFAISQAVEKKTRKEEKLLLIGLTNQY